MTPDDSKYTSPCQQRCIALFIAGCCVTSVWIGIAIMMIPSTDMIWNGSEPDNDLEALVMMTTIGTALLGTPTALLAYALVRAIQKGGHRKS